MKVATGRVVEGKIVLEGEPLAEGAVVTVALGTMTTRSMCLRKTNACFSTRWPRPTEVRAIGNFWRAGVDIVPVTTIVNGVNNERCR